MWKEFLRIVVLAKVHAKCPCWHRIMRAQKIITCYLYFYSVVTTKSQLLTNKKIIRLFKVNVMPKPFKVLINGLLLFLNWFVLPLILLNGELRD